LYLSQANKNAWAPSALKFRQVLLGCGLGDQGRILATKLRALGRGYLGFPTSK
jgi:hypothetical protein